MFQKTVTVVALVLGAALYAEQQSPTELMEAAIYKDDAAQVKAAIKAGADPNGGIYAGHYLGFAASRNSQNAVRALVESGADVNKRSYGGWTAAMAAADNGFLDILRYLASKKADLQARTRQGRTLLMRTAVHGQDEVIKYLLAQGLNVNAHDSNGVTALMLAAQQGYDTTVKLLLEADAKRELKDSKSRSAIDFIREKLEGDQNQRANYKKQSDSDQKDITAKNYVAFYDKIIEKDKRIISLLSSGAKNNSGKLVGKIFSVTGKKIVITGKGVSKLRVGAKVIVKSAKGEIVATVKEVLHSRAKATAQKSGIAKGDAVHLSR